jgi:hypothetical protein
MSGESDAYVAIPKGVGQDARRCWQGYDDLGRAFDGGEGEPHYYERGQVGDGLNPKQHSEPCWLVTCAGCDYRLDEDGSWVMHHDSAQEAVKMALDHDWLLIDGGLYCSVECEGLPPDTEVPCACTRTAHGDVLWRCPNKGICRPGLRSCKPCRRGRCPSGPPPQSGEGGESRG